MKSTTDQFFKRIENPMFQAAVAIGMVLVLMVSGKLVRMSGLITVPVLFPWMTAAAFMLLFAMFNSVISLSVADMIKYWGRSVYGFLGLAAGAGFLAYMFSSIPIGEAGSYRWIYVVVSFGYLVFLIIMALVRKIVEFAEKEEWTQPRQRRKR